MKIKIIVGILILTFLLLSFVSSKKQSTMTFPSIIEAQQAETVLRFSPNPLILSSTNGKIDIEMDTKENTITFVQVKLNFSSKDLSDMKIIKGPFFKEATVLNTFIDQKNGTLTYILTLPKDTKGISGKGIIATLSFKTTLTKDEQTTLRFSKETIVANNESSGSLLRETENGVIVKK